VANDGSGTISFAMSLLIFNAPISAVALFAEVAFMLPLTDAPFDSSFQLSVK
jgi:hypothetical protein